MSKKICFSSVLKQKRGYQNVQNVLNRQAPQISLRQMVQNFQGYPNGDFTLRYHNIRGCSSKQGFDQNFNQLDQFIQNHVQNKQNISDTQPKKTIPSQLLKFLPGNKSPKRISQTKSGLTSTQQHKNVDMKQICKEYAENKKNGRDLGKAPVWRFNGKNQDYELQEQKQVVQRPNYIRQSQKTIKQSKVQQKYQQTRNQSRFNQNKQFNKINSQNNLNVQRLQNTTKGNNNILKLVEQIKSNIVPEIELMAQRIIHQRTKVQDDQLLLSQRQSEEQKGQKRIDNAKKQIGQYLSMKIGNGSSLQSKDKQTNMAPIQKINQNSFKQIQQKISSSNQNVGYSFSSDFQSQNYSKPNQSSNNVEYLVKNSSHSQNIQMPKAKKQLQVDNTSFNNISLPNIDEVKSEKDPNQRLQQDFGESVAINLRNFSKADPQSIDKNFIKQIQSVAYTEPEPYSRQNPISYNKMPQKMQYENQKMTKQSEKLEKKKSGSLFQQISKTALSIEANNQQQDSQEVNISIAQKKQSPNIRSNQSSARNQNKENNSPAVQVNNFLTPANTVKIQFKKLPSPRRTSKQNSQFKQQVKDPLKFQINKANQTFTQANTTLLNRCSTKVQTVQNYIPSQQQPYRTSFSNILQQNNKNSPVSMEKTIQNQTIQMAIVNIKHMSSQLQPTFTYNPIINTTSNNSGNTNLPSQTIQQHQQNSRQRNNSLKNSNHDDQSRKLKITISPKYHGNQHDRHDLIANVGDFKLGNVKMQESTQANKYIKVSNVGNSIQKKLNPSTNQSSKIHPASTSSSIAVKDSINNNKTRVDNILSNIPKVSNKVVTLKRQNPQENALIRIQKYQRVEKVVQPAPAAKKKQSVSIKNNQSIKSSQQFEFDLDF